MKITNMSVWEPVTRRQEQNQLINAGFEVLTSVVMKSSVFWDIMLCSLLLYCLSYSLTLKMRAICSSKMLFQVASRLLHTGFLLGLIFDPEDGGNMLHQNVD
jgi:hypothetical protein